MNKMNNDVFKSVLTKFYDLKSESSEEKASLKWTYDFIYLF